MMRSKLIILFVAALALSSGAQEDSCPFETEISKQLFQKSVQGNDGETTEAADFLGQDEASETCPLFLGLFKLLIQETIQESGEETFEDQKSSKNQYKQIAERLNRLEAHWRYFSQKLPVIEKSSSEMPTILNQLKKLEEQIQILMHPSNCVKARRLGLTRLQFGDYYFHQQPDRNWMEAKNFCQQNGMQLAIFESWQELQNVGDNNPKRGKAWAYWVDASDVAEQPGRYSWADGTQVDKSFWYTDNPNKYAAGQKTCVHMIASHGKLADYSCSQNWSFVCKLAVQDSSCLSI